MQCCPEVDDVAVSLAGCLVTTEDILVQVDAEGSGATVGTMDRTRSPSLGTRTTQPLRQAQVVQDTRQRQLFFQVGEVQVGIVADGRLG